MKRWQGGQTIIEVMVAIALAAIVLPAMATAVVASREGRAQENERLQATALARQATEAVRSVREKGWSNIAALTAASPYHPVVASNAWSLSAGTETIGNFTRQVVASDVQRDSGGTIVTSGGTVDQSTRKLTVTVSWTQPVVGSVVLEAYYQRYMSNAAWTQSTQAEFNGGTPTNTVVTATGGGQVELGAGNTTRLMQSNTAFDDATSTTISLGFTENVRAGDLIVAVVSRDTTNSTTITCSDDQGNTYTSAVNTNDATGVKAQTICYAPNAIGGPTTVTATFGATATTRRIAIHEYRGIVGTAPVDVSRGVAAANTVVANNVSTGNMTTTVAGALIFGAVTETGAATGVTITAGTGYTQRTLNDSEVASQDRFQVAAGAIASTQTFNKVSRYVAQEVAFKVTGGIPANWVQPNILKPVDVPGTEDQTVVQVVGNYAYVTDTAVLSIYDITDPSAPVALGTYTAAAVINDFYVSGNYVYLATADNAGEMVIVNATNKSSLSTANTVNPANNEDGLAVYVRGNYAYLGRALSATASHFEFYVYDVTNPAAPVQKGAIDLTGQVNALYAPTADHVYAATSATGAEISVVRVTTPTAPVAAGVYDASGTSIGTDITGDGTHIYLAKNNNTSGTEFFELTPNVSVPTAVTFTLDGGFETGANINGIAISGNTAFLASSTANNQLRVLNITTPASITQTGILSLGAAANAANAVDVSGNYAYMATAMDTKDLLVVQAVPSALNTYEQNASFESSSFDATASAAYNSLLFNSSEPAGTNITFQVASNNDNATWNYVGPDGTSGTSYSANGALRVSTVGRYFRYKATLTGPGASTPALQDVTINYSP